MTAIITRELRTYFQTPLVYVFMGLFLLLSAFFFTLGNLIGASSNFLSFLGSILFELEENSMMQSLFESLIKRCSPIVDNKHLILMRP